MLNVLLRMIAFSLMVPAAVAAKSTEPTGIGLVAQNLMAPVSLMSNFVFSGCLIIGASFIFASIVKYFEHRRSPLMVPLSTVLFLFFAGAFLIALPFTYMLIENGSSYTSIK